MILLTVFTCDLLHVHNLYFPMFTVPYYATVRAYAENGAYVDSTSDGIRVGFTPGMIAGEVESPPFGNSSSEISASWSEFWSDLGIQSYHLGISSQPFAASNTTLLCETLLALSKQHFDVFPLTDVKRDTFARATGITLKHNTIYYVSVIGEDIAGQCIASHPVQVLVDLTSPEQGVINIGGPSQNAQYIPDPEQLILHFDGFHDPESGIHMFHFQVRLKNNKKKNNMHACIDIYIGVF